MQDLIQVAGITDAAEARMLIDCGVDWLGFPLRLSVHHEDLPECEAAGIMSGIDSPHRGVLITYLTEADDIISLCRYLGADTVQLHNQIDTGKLAIIRDKSPEFTIIKSLIIYGENQRELEEQIDRLSPLVDAFITDTYDPVTGASGATGKTHDWTISKKLVELSEKPVILAGGLTPDNVGEAISMVRPAGVDVHTGVESVTGRKDRAKVNAFVRAARSAFATIHRDLKS